jgi:hypothetical protein
MAGNEPMRKQRTELSCREKVSPTIIDSGGGFDNLNRFLSFFGDLIQPLSDPNFDERLARYTETS